MGLHDTSSKIVYPPVAPVAKRAIDAWRILEQTVFHNTLLEKLVQGEALPASILSSGGIFEGDRGDGRDEDDTSDLHGCPYARIEADELAELRSDAESNMLSFLVKCSSC